MPGQRYFINRSQESFVGNRSERSGSSLAMETIASTEGTDDPEADRARARAAASVELLEAARSGKTRRAIRMIQAADNLNLATEDGWTALHFSSFHGDGGLWSSTPYARDPHRPLPDPSSY